MESTIPEAGSESALAERLTDCADVQEVAAVKLIIALRLHENPVFRREYVLEGEFTSIDWVSLRCDVAVPGALSDGERAALRVACSLVPWLYPVELNLVQAFAAVDGPTRRVLLGAISTAVGGA